MQRAAIRSLQIMVVALGLGIAAALLYEPWVEGINANATSFRDIYLDDPFLAYTHVAFIPVFVGLYYAFTFVGTMGHGPDAARALNVVKYCALTFAGFITGALTYLAIFIRGTDDITGGIAIGLFLIVSSFLVAFGAHTLEERRTGSTD